MTGRMLRALLGLFAVVLLAAVATSCSRFDDTAVLQEDPVGARSATPSDVPPAPASRPEAGASTEPHVELRGQPHRVVIPAINVDVELVRLGLQADGAMEVPAFGSAGWYTEGPEPGHPGPAVIAAHFDSRAGPDVFHRLGDLTAGDGIHVVYDSGDQVTFLVHSREQTPKDELPVDAIWPTTDERLLTLITCGGEFDSSVRHYRDNVIVYATQAHQSAA